MNPQPLGYKSSYTTAIRRAPLNLQWIPRLSIPGAFQWTPHPSILASAPASTKEEGESDDHVDSIADGAERRRPWADIATPLLDHLLPSISLFDRVRLSAVCRQWLDFLADHPSLRRPQFPWIMLRTIKDDHVYEIFCPSDDGHCILRFPTTNCSRCIASSHGWLFFNDFCESQERSSIRGLFLINPLTKACVDLPACPRYYTEAALSAAPTEPGCIVMRVLWYALDKWDICHCRIGDEAWHVRREHFKPMSNVTAMDGKFYMLCREGLAEMDFNQSCPLRWINMNRDEAFKGIFLKDRIYPHFLVESNGELFVITLLESEEHKLLHIEKRDEFLACVYKADLKNKIWTRVENLQGRSLFLSSGSCFSLPAPATDAGGGCIYATSRSIRPVKDSLWHEHRVFRGFLDQWPPHGYHVEHCHWHFTWFMPNI